LLAGAAAGLRSPWPDCHLHRIALTWLYCKNGHELNNIVKATRADTITAKLNLLIRRS
jgi:hypothetical protein